MKNFLLSVSHQLNVGQLSAHLFNYQCLPFGEGHVRKQKAQKTVYVFACKKVDDKALVELKGNEERGDTDQSQSNHETTDLAISNETPAATTSENETSDDIDEIEGVLDAVVSPPGPYYEEKEKVQLPETTNCGDCTEQPLQKSFMAKICRYSAKSWKMLIILLLFSLIINGFFYVMRSEIFSKDTCQVIVVGYNYTTHTAPFATPCLALSEVSQKAHNNSKRSLTKTMGVRADWQICVQAGEPERSLVFGATTEENCKLNNEATGFEMGNNSHLGPVKRFTFSASDGGCVDQLNRTMPWQSSFCALPPSPKQYVQVKADDAYASIYCYRHKLKVKEEPAAFENLL
ncbi:hypothetical protein TYRP_017530 [Tyrophagus putrescentiae]|nr:hypothetical protein TYRP_017530 [Tyrophagus putrescentiae]